MRTEPREPKPEDLIPLSFEIKMGDELMARFTAVNDLTGTKRYGNYRVTFERLVAPGVMGEPAQFTASCVPRWGSYLILVAEICQAFMLNDVSSCLARGDTGDDYLYGGDLPEAPDAFKMAAMRRYGESVNAERARRGLAPLEVPSREELAVALEKLDESEVETTRAEARGDTPRETVYPASGTPSSPNSTAAGDARKVEALGGGT